METEHLLAAYGTLRAGEVKHRLLADVPGEWLDGWVRGSIGEVDGLPAFWHDPDGPRQPVKVFHSAPGIARRPSARAGRAEPRTSKNSQIEDQKPSRSSTDQRHRAS